MKTHTNHEFINAGILVLSHLVSHCLAIPIINSIYQTLCKGNISSGIMKTAISLNTKVNFHQNNVANRQYNERRNKFTAARATAFYELLWVRATAPYMTPSNFIWFRRFFAETALQLMPLYCRQRYRAAQ